MGTNFFFFTLVTSCFFANLFLLVMALRDYETRLNIFLNTGSSRKSSLRTIWRKDILGSYWRARPIENGIFIENESFVKSRSRKWEDAWRRGENFPPKNIQFCCNLMIRSQINYFLLNYRGGVLSQGVGWPRRVMFVEKYEVKHIFCLRIFISSS